MRIREILSEISDRTLKSKSKLGTGDLGISSSFYGDGLQDLSGVESFRVYAIKKNDRGIDVAIPNSQQRIRIKDLNMSLDQFNSLSSSEKQEYLKFIYNYLIGRDYPDDQLVVNTVGTSNSPELKVRVTRSDNSSDINRPNTSLTDVQIITKFLDNYKGEPLSIANIMSKLRGLTGPLQDYQKALLPNIIDNFYSNPDSGRKLYPINVLNDINLIQKYGIYTQKAIATDFGEIIGPVALITGNASGGNAKRLLQQFMGASDTKDLISNSHIIFNTGKTDPLYDSYVYYKGKVIAISSKANEGGKAGASITGLQRAIQEVKLNDIAVNRFKKLINEDQKYNSIYQILTLITKSYNTDGSTINKGEKAIRLLRVTSNYLNLNVYDESSYQHDIKIINDLTSQYSDKELDSTKKPDVVQEDDYVQNFNPTSWKGFSEQLSNIFAQYKKSEYGDQLQTLDEFKPYSELLFAINYTITEILNNTPEFSQMCSFILNHSNTIQIDIITGEESGSLPRRLNSGQIPYTITNVVANWPSTSTTSVTLIPGSLNKMYISVNGFSEQFGEKGRAASNRMQQILNNQLDKDGLDFAFNSDEDSLKGALDYFNQNVYKTMSNSGNDDSTSSYIALSGPEITQLATKYTYNELQVKLNEISNNDTNYTNAMLDEIMSHQAQIVSRIIQNKPYDRGLEQQAYNDLLKIKETDVARWNNIVNELKSSSLLTKKDNIRRINRPSSTNPYINPKIPQISDEEPPQNNTDDNDEDETIQLRGKLKNEIYQLLISNEVSLYDLISKYGILNIKRILPQLSTSSTKLVYRTLRGSTMLRIVSSDTPLSSRYHNYGNHIFGPEQKRFNIGGMTLSTVPQVLTLVDNILRGKYTPEQITQIENELTQLTEAEFINSENYNTLSKIVILSIEAHNADKKKDFDDAKERLQKVLKPYESQAKVKAINGILDKISNRFNLFNTIFQFNNLLYTPNSIIKTMANLYKNKTSVTSEYDLSRHIKRIMPKLKDEEKQYIQQYGNTNNVEEAKGKTPTSITKSNFLDIISLMFWTYTHIEQQSDHTSTTNDILLKILNNLSTNTGLATEARKYSNIINSYKNQVQRGRPAGSKNKPKTPQATPSVQNPTTPSTPTPPDTNISESTLYSKLYRAMAQPHLTESQSPSTQQITATAQRMISNYSGLKYKPYERAVDHAHSYHRNQPQYQYWMGVAREIERLESFKNKQPH